MAKMTKKGQEFVGDEISHLMKDGPSKGPQKDKKMPQKQAIAVALDVARRKGFKSSPNPNTTTEQKTVETVTYNKYLRLKNRKGEDMSIFDNIVEKNSTKSMFDGIVEGTRWSQRSSIFDSVVACESETAAPPESDKPESSGDRKPSTWYSGKSSWPRPKGWETKSPSDSHDVVERAEKSMFDDIVESDDDVPEPPPSYFEPGGMRGGKHDTWDALTRKKSEPTKKNPWPWVKPGSSSGPEPAKPYEPKSSFDEFDEVGESRSMFDNIVESKNRSSTAVADWDDRVARTLTLTEGLVEICTSIKSK